jgi:hypothetical protein
VAGDLDGGIFVNFSKEFACYIFLDCFSDASDQSIVTVSHEREVVLTLVWDVS